jgi:hypothetical protein
MLSEAALLTFVVTPTGFEKQVVCCAQCSIHLSVAWIRKYRGLLRSRDHRDWGRIGRLTLSYVKGTNIAVNMSNDSS